jgi:DnaJ-class molecular chaperone
MEDLYRQLLTEWAEKGAYRGGDSAYKKNLIERTRAALEAAQPSVQRTCPSCGGKGTIKTDWVGLVVCTTCNGAGQSR